MLVLASEERGSGVPQQLGYTEKDSAGQSNIFAVEPKSYVQGSSADSGKGSTPYSIVAGIFAVAAISAGLYITVNNGPVEAPTSGSAGGESLQVIYERLSGSEAPWL